MNKFFLFFKGFLKENFSDSKVENNSINTSSVDNKEPDKKNSLNQPSLNSNKERDSSKTKKVILIVISLLIGGGLITGIVVSSLATGPKQFNYDNISVSNKESFELTSTDGKKRTVKANDRPTFYYYLNTDTFKVAFGNNFTGWYFVVTKVNLGELGTYIKAGEWFIGTNGKINKFAINSSYNGLEATDVQDDTLLGKMLSNIESKSIIQASKFDWSIIFNFLPIILSIVFFVILLRMMRGAGQGGGHESVFSIGKSQAKIAQSNIKFSDVAGIEEEKNELIELVDYLKRPEKYVAMGARVPKGVILYGPPGTGKTLLAKAVAGEAQVPFFQVSGSAFEDMLVGVGAKRVRDLFNKAIKSSPAIIFIDEIDSVGSKRGKLETTSGSLADQTLNQLLAEMDGFNSRTGVIVIAATNRLDVLDDALLRPGRFDRHIQVNLPDIKERNAILKIHSKNKNLSSNVELDDIARRTPGFSGAQLENVLNEATLLAVRKNKNSISTEDLDEAIDRVIGGPAKKTKVISAEEKKQIAYHEAGHALVGLHIKGGDVVQKITIIPRGQAAGYTLSVPEKQELSIQKKSDLLGLIASALGGRASEEFVYGKDSVSTGAANDLYKVTNVVRSMVMQLGMSDLGMTQFVPSEGTVNPYQQKLYSDQTSLLIDKEIDKIISKQYSVAMEIIKKNKKELDLIVETLLLLETIVKPQIDYIHKNLKLPDEALEKKKELEIKKNKAKETEKKTEENKKDIKEIVEKIDKKLEEKDKKSTLEKEKTEKK